MEKIIFLDIDGVLFTSEHYKYLSLSHKKYKDKYGFIFDPVCVARFNEIMEKTSAKIVLSSSWRMAGLDTMKKCFGVRGVDGDLIDLTPISTIDDWFISRGEEIEFWLSRNGMPDKFVVIDDASLGEEYDKWKGFFKTTMTTGITEEIKDNIINYLNDN